MNLPAGWFESTGDALRYRETEYRRELPRHHALADAQVQVVAHREATDDILLQHLSEPDTFSVVHLTWSGRTELPDHPSVEFTGTLAQFLAWEAESWGAGRTGRMTTKGTR